MPASSAAVSPDTAISPLTQQIANAIGEYCGARNIQAVDATHGDFVRWLKEEKDLNADELRKVRLHLQRVGGFTALRNNFFVSVPSASFVEREEMKAISKLSRSNLEVMARDDLFLKRFTEVMEKSTKVLAKMKVPVFRGKKRGARDGKVRRIVHLMISDTHFGSNLDPRELPYKYSFEEEARALASVIIRLCEFKVDHRDETELVLWFGGDLTRGKIHDKQAGLPAAEQGADAMFLLTQVVHIASANFRKVTVYCSSGNHDRDESRHEGTAYEQKWDSRATMVYFGVKLACAHLENVEVNIPRTPHAEWEVFGKRVYATHGDTNLDVGNPAKAVDIARIDKQMKTINLAQVQRGLKPYAAFLVGHLHQGMHLPLPAADLVVNPALIPVDGFAGGVGYAMTHPGQTLFESTEQYVVGDLRFFHVTPEIMKDKALEKVIAPFQDF